MIFHLQLQQEPHHLGLDREQIIAKLVVITIILSLFYIESPSPDHYDIKSSFDNIRT